jgi:hypothetical protein
MPSLDYAYDLLDKLSDDNLDYALIVISKGKEIYKADIFEYVTDEDSRQCMVKTLADIKKNLTVRKRKKKK